MGESVAAHTVLTQGVHASKLAGWATQATAEGRLHGRRPSAEAVRCGAAAQPIKWRGDSERS